jgi:hypothetical protein
MMTTELIAKLQQSIEIHGDRTIEAYVQSPERYLIGPLKEIKVLYREDPACLIFWFEPRKPEYYR